MTEGWLREDYLILFDEKSLSLEAEYDLSAYLPGYRLVGLRGWDDFIVEDSGGRLFTVPTVPLLSDHLSPLRFEDTQGDLIPDDRLKGKIKWYVTPLVLGGDPKPGNNMIWVTLDQHTQLVKWWNLKYRELTQNAK
jgi:hypothetical protein